MARDKAQRPRSRCEELPTVHVDHGTGHAGRKIRRVEQTAPEPQCGWSAHHHAASV